MQRMTTPNEPAQRRRITITLPGGLHEQGKRLASADRRDFSYYLEVLIERDSRARLGVAPASAGQPQAAEVLP
jgi:hypothetical protein